MKIVCGLCLLIVILRATGQVLFPTQLGTRLPRPLYIYKGNNVRCQTCKQPLLPIPVGPLQSPIAALPEPAVQGFPGTMLVPRTDKTDEGQQVQITQNEEVIFRNKGDIERFLTERGGNSSLLMSILGEYKEKPGSPNTSKPVESLPQKDRSIPVDRVSDEKAIECAQIECGLEEMKGPLCACNFKTGNTVSFKNECDLKKHNCRFNTGFKTILDEICPWQFVSRSATGQAENMRINYEDSRYYNK